VLIHRPRQLLKIAFDQKVHANGIHGPVGEFLGNRGRYH
jgi:hypothetical protein